MAKQVIMGEVVPFKKPRLTEKHKDKIPCKNGHHKWKTANGQRFVKPGKLVTRYRCKCCYATKNRSI